MAGLSITWFGHATFVVTTPGGKRVVFDPWLTGNPKAPAGAKIDKADVICLTHGHSDHSGDVVAVARGTRAPLSPAVQTSSIEENGKVHYVGLATGFVVRMEDHRAIYFAGDTALFGDMRLIG